MHYDIYYDLQKVIEKAFENIDPRFPIYISLEDCKDLYDRALTYQKNNNYCLKNDWLDPVCSFNFYSKKIEGCQDFTKYSYKKHTRKDWFLALFLHHNYEIWENVKSILPDFFINE